MSDTAGEQTEQASNLDTQTHRLPHIIVVIMLYHAWSSTAHHGCLRASCRSSAFIIVTHKAAQR